MDKNIYDVPHLTNNNLSSVEPPIVARAVARLEKVRLGSTSLTTPQAASILSAAAADTSRIKRLSMWFNPGVEAVDEVVVARARERLETFEV